jgi:hypothetical protein
MTKPSSTAQKVRRHREKLRAQGLSPLQIWAPNVNDPRIAEQMRREALAIAHSEYEREDTAFIDSLYDESIFER